MLIFRYFASQETRKANLIEHYPKLKNSLIIHEENTKEMNV